MTTDKFIGYFRLLDACEEIGCPVCRCLEDDSRRALDAILHEHVTDPDTRTELRAACGFCNWHAWSLVDARTAATGAAILYEDLLRECRHQVERVLDGRTSSKSVWRSRLRAFLGASMAPGAPPSSGTAFHQRPRCPLCRRLGAAEAAYMDAAVAGVDDPRFTAAYQRSSGLCLPHLTSVLERGTAREGMATLVRMTLARWEHLRAGLARFVAKHEYRNTEPITDDEARASRLAAEVLAGRRQLFPTDRHPDAGGLTR